jgi:hypothetical protein
MKRPIAVTFHGISHREWIETDILKRAAKLERYCRRIVSCHIVVDLPHRHHEGGNRFNLRIDLKVPGNEIAVTRGATLHASRKDLGDREWQKQFDIEGMRKDLRLVIREAFDVATRKLQQYSAEKRRPRARTRVAERLAS